MNSIERKIVERIVDDALAQGYGISVRDGGEVTVRRSTDRAEIVGALGTTGEDQLGFHLIVDGVPERRTFGMVWLVYGNDTDVISDSIDNELTNLILKGAEALAEQLSG